MTGSFLVGRDGCYGMELETMAPSSSAARTKFRASSSLFKLQRERTTDNHFIYESLCFREI
jgi:hypothetical protein